MNKKLIHWLVLIAIGSYVLIAMIMVGLPESLFDIQDIITVGVGFGLGIICIGVGLIKYIEKQRAVNY